MLCASDRYKVYLEDDAGKLAGILQAKQIARKILELSRRKSDEDEMLPAIAYVLNFNHGRELAETPVSVQADTPLKKVVNLMDRNSIREIPVHDRLSSSCPSLHLSAVFPVLRL
jgi:CBS domain-containing protein